MSTNLNGCISGDALPFAFQLTTYWSENREALLSYMEHVHTGIKGIIFDKATNSPISGNATIQVQKLSCC